jgi:hypothetical protein
LARPAFPHEGCQMLRCTAGGQPWPWGLGSEAAFAWQTPTSGDQRWPRPRPVKLRSVGHAEGATGLTNVEPAPKLRTRVRFASPAPSLGPPRYDGEREFCGTIFFLAPAGRSLSPTTLPLRLDVWTRDRGNNAYLALRQSRLR